jgi:UDP-N-acetylglucosamine--N-acetylmuramyl-(pentapeptide) pyrophosphoryl-undecaprenol N-acetylglucosamine transferase
MPVACYTYPKEKIVQTGLPISAAFAKTASAPRQSLRRELGLSAHLPVVLVAPGSSGAKVINDALMEILPKLLTAHNVSIVHIAGPKNYQAVLAAYKTSGIDMSNIVVRPFVDNLYEYSRAADIVVTRAGSMLIELAAQSCAVISIPNPYLTGGHQLRNAELYKLSKAVKVIDEQKLTADPSTLQRAIGTLLKDAAERIRLGRALHAFYQPKAAENIASLLIKVAQSRG